MDGGFWSPTAVRRAPADSARSHALALRAPRSFVFQEKYYQKNVYYPPENLSPPPAIPKNNYWPKAVLSLTERAVLESAGTDALMYLKTLRFAFEVFLLVTFFVCAIILPINITGSNVDSLTSSPYDPSTISPFIEWYLPGLNGTAINGTDNSTDSTDAVTSIKAPKIYNTSIGPAPPGLLWWERLPDVPPLPTPESVLGPAYENYTWIYDDKYQVVQYDLTALDKTTMTNIEEKSDSLYAHAIVTWVVTALVVWRLREYSKQALNLRMLFFMNGGCFGGLQAQSVLVRDIPLRSSAVKETEDKGGEGGEDAGSWFERKFGRTLTKRRGGGGTEGDLAVVLPDRWEEAAAKVGSKEMAHAWLVRNEFEELYGKHEVVESVAVYNTAKLTAAVGAYEKTKEAAFSTIDKVVSSYADEKKREKMKKPVTKMVIGKTMGAWGSEKYGLKPKKVDAFEFFCDRLEHLRGEVLREQEDARSHPVPSAFVSFRSKRAQVTASQTMMCEDLDAWVTGPAPGVNEIFWSNLRMRKRERDIRDTAYTVSFWLLMAFYMIPVSAVQVLLSSNSLVGFLQTIPIANALLTGILPGLALRLFIILLPMILNAMLLKIKGVISRSDQDGRLQSGMYIFQFITVFLGTFIAGTFANQFQQLLDDPGSIVQIFGTAGRWLTDCLTDPAGMPVPTRPLSLSLSLSLSLAAPQVGIFFWTYILTIACWEIPMDIVDAVGLALYNVFLKLASTARSKQKVCEARSAFNYGAMAPDDGIIFLLGIAFSVVSPLIAPCALIYFGVRYLVNKHNLAYKLAPEYDAGGSFFLTAFNQFVTGLVAFHLIMIFILAIKESIGPPIIVAPLPLITLGWFMSARASLRKPFADHSIMMAHDGDLNASPSPENAKATGTNAQTYVDPVFVFDQDDHDTAMHQCTVLKNAQAQPTWPNETIATLIDDTDGSGGNGNYTSPSQDDHDYHDYHDVEEQ